jgi:hypothetical protein
MPGHPSPLDKLHLTVIQNPSLILCPPCTTAFTPNAIYDHLVQDHDLEKGQTLQELEGLASFADPPQPIAALPIIPVIQARLCIVSDCALHFSDPDAFHAHMRTKHPEVGSSEGEVIHLQEVQDASGIKIFRIQVVQKPINQQQVRVLSVHQRIVINRLIVRYHTRRCVS